MVARQRQSEPTVKGPNVFVFVLDCLALCAHLICKVFSEYCALTTLEVTFNLTTRRIYKTVR